MKKCGVLVLAIALTGVAGEAASSDDAGIFLRGKLDAVIAVLQTEGLDSQEKEQRAIDIIMPVFDMQLMAKLAVGKKFWPAFSSEQKNRFTHAFTRRLQKLYMGKIMQYTDEEIVYKTPVTSKRKVHIPTDLIAGDSRYSILYKMYRSKGGWKIYDIELDRVSILKSFRSQISQVLNTGTFEDLIQKLETPVDTN